MERHLEIGARRRCDFDGRLYTVKKPDHRFCSDNCRKKYHKGGSAYLILRDRMNREIHSLVKAAADEAEARILRALDTATQHSYSQLFPERASRAAELNQAKRQVVAS